MRDGLLLVDKPSGMTSHDVVARARRALKTKNIGHTGTLDPLATGLLILVIGDATKLSDYLVASEKQYEVTVKLGVKSDTLDREGKITERFEGVWPARERWIEAAQELQGDFEWPIPIFSAAKVDGKKLYEHARKGEMIETPVKAMSFWDVQVGEVGDDSLRAILSCSKGSFIRTWASQLGEALKVGGLVQELRRLRVGPWPVEDAIDLERLEKEPWTDNLEFKPKAFIPLAQALPGLKTVLANPKEARLVGHGQIPRDMMSRLIFEQKQAYESGRSVFVKVVSVSGDLLALLAAEPGQGLKIKRVFRTLS